MFLVSGPELVLAACKAGVIGAFAAFSARTEDELQGWLDQIREGLAEAPHAAPYAVNLVVHRTNPRLQRDVAACVAAKAPIAITSVGHDPEVLAAVKSYGGVVLHDVANMRHVEKAIAAGVDGLVLLCAGAGGQVGRPQPLSPFAFAAEVRRVWDGVMVLAGSIADGRAIRAAQVLGADLAYVGTRFIATAESRASAEYKAMLTTARADDVLAVKTPAGVWANLLEPSLRRAGIDPAAITASGAGVDMAALAEGSKLWRDVWAAGHGVGQVDAILPAAEVIARLAAEYRAAF